MPKENGTNSLGWRFIFQYPARETHFFKIKKKLAYKFQKTSSPGIAVFSGRMVSAVKSLPSIPLKGMSISTLAGKSKMAFRSQAETLDFWSCRLLCFSYPAGKSDFWTVNLLSCNSIKIKHQKGKMLNKMPTIYINEMQFTCKRV